MLVLCLMLSMTHYAQNYDGIICGSLAAGIIYTLNTVHKASYIIINKKLNNEIRENLIPTKFNNHTVQYKILQHNRTQTYLTTGQPS